MKSRKQRKYPGTINATSALESLKKAQSDEVFGTAIKRLKSERNFGAPMFRM